MASFNSFQAKEPREATSFFSSSATLTQEFLHVWINLQFFGPLMDHIPIATGVRCVGSQDRISMVR